MFLATTLFHRGGALDLAIWLTDWLTKKFDLPIWINQYDYQMAPGVSQIVPNDSQMVPNHSQMVPNDSRSVPDDSMVPTNTESEL